MKPALNPALRDMFQRVRTLEGCEVLNLKGTDETGQPWEHVIMRCPPLALEIKNSERVYAHSLRRDG